MANLRDVLKVASPILGAAGVFDKKDEGLKKVGAEAVMPGMGAGMKKGGSVRSASSRADGIATKGKTRGTIIACGGGMMRK